MQYQEIQRMLMQSDPKNDWKSPSSDFGEEVWFYRHDVNLRIERVDYDSDGETFDERWATKHPDPRAERCYYGIWYGNTLIDQVMLVAVDGWRAIFQSQTRKRRLKSIATASISRLPKSLTGPVAYTNTSSGQD